MTVKTLLSIGAPSYKPWQLSVQGTMNSRRIIESAVGNRMALEILPGSDGIRLSREDATVGDVVVLDARGSRILAAFLASGLVVNRSSRPPEEIEDAQATVLTLHDDPAPLVRITQGARVLDVHAPSWEPLRCEIELVIPRLDGNPIHSKLRH